MWGTMYVPYRKAYVSGMNPLSFVTIFTVGELVTVFALVLALDGGTHAAVFHSPAIRHLLFWLFLGGFVWVIGDLFQQFATRFLGIGRAIPLSNTNQIWGLAWGALVFGELAHADSSRKMLVVIGTTVMILGALAVSTAVAGAREQTSMNGSIERECTRYGLDFDHILEIYTGSGARGDGSQRRWWDYAILAAAGGVFVYLALNARLPALAMNFPWLSILVVILVVSATYCALRLWKATRFS
jgi:hypothetical protein